MYFSYGDYIHAKNEIEFSSISHKTEFSRRGKVQCEKVTWGLAGVLHSSDDTIATLTVEMAELQEAYREQFQNAILFLDDLVTPTQHALYNALAWGGVRVVGFNWAPSKGAEYTTYRGYSITLQADFPGDDNLVEWQETVTIRGTGGPRFVYLEVTEGEPQKQIVQQRTTMKATQTGSAKGLYSHPGFNEPYWEQDEHELERGRTRGSPDQVGENRWHFPIAWSYNFEGLDLQGGTPEMPE